VKTSAEKGEALRVRAMTISDIDALMALERQSESAPHWSREDYLACVRESGDSAVRRIGLIADFHNIFAGFAILRCLTVAGGTEVELESIVVSGELRCRGIGGSLLDSAIAAAKRHGAEHLDLEVRESNGAAARLYARFGFTETGRRRGYYHGPEEDAVLMSLTL
jgi:ribosomal-protein-alanine N-acetyltransferase